MKQVKFYIKDILQYLCTLLQNNKIGDGVFAEHRPVGIGEQLSNLSVVSLPVEIFDRGAYQSTQIRFDLISRERQGGIAATDELQDMLDKLISLIPIVELRFSITSPKVIFRGDDQNGFTIWVVIANLIINTTDRLEYVGK